MIMDKRKSKGFTLIELIVAIGLSLIFIPAVGTLLSNSVFTASQGENFTKASSLAREQMEAIYSIKQIGDSTWDWDSTPTGTLSGEYYQPTLVAGVWQLGTKTTTPVEVNGFTKTVEIKDVCRDPVSDEIVTCGAIDSGSREVIVTVSWQERGKLQTVELTSYVTRH
jgi:prepilin-type N-terminal cleavage/methylation domain-containing protein